MSMSAKERNILVGGIVAVIVIGLLAFLLGRGCEEEQTTTVSTNTVATTPTTTTPTTTTEPATTLSQTVIESPAPQASEPPAATESLQPMRIGFAVATQADGMPADTLGQGIEFTVGFPYQIVADNTVYETDQPIEVKMELWDSGGYGSNMQEVQLSYAFDDQGHGIWGATIPSPPTAGMYHFRAIARAADGTISIGDEKTFELN